MITEQLMATSLLESFLYLTKKGEKFMSERMV
jgi:hypothetical protein